MSPLVERACVGWGFSGASADSGGVVPWTPGGAGTGGTGAVEALAVSRSVWRVRPPAAFDQICGSATQTVARAFGFTAIAVENAQISNASGVLGEGLPYADGDFDLDPAIRWLGEHTRHIVTETLEANNDEAISMRDALRRMRSVLG